MIQDKITSQDFRKIRERMKYTRKAMAKQIGVSWETVKSWETRKPKKEIPKYAHLALLRIQINHAYGTNA